MTAKIIYYNAEARRVTSPTQYTQLRQFSNSLTIYFRTLALHICVLADPFRLIELLYLKF